jgi:hypothetical protein
VEGHVETSPLAGGRTKTTADSGEICPNGSVEAAKTAEEGSQIQPEPDPSGSCGGHADVGAQTGATRDSDTEYLAETYVIIDSEVVQNGSLATEILLQPRIINAVTSAFDEQFVAHTVLFPVFTRYFLAS